jgi:hypothetical protein
LSGIVAYNRNKKARCSNARYLKKGMCFLFLYWLLEVRIFKNIHLRRTLLLFIYLLCSYASVYCVISISIFGALSKIVLENYAPYPSIQVTYIWWYTHTHGLWNEDILQTWCDINTKLYSIYSIKKKNYST